jgi:hypothetical protein
MDSERPAPKLTIDTNGNGDPVEETILAAMAGVTPEPA